MSFLVRIIIHIIANGAAILAADKLVPGFRFMGGWPDLAIAAAVLGIVNSFIRPVIKLITFPVILLTLGLFSVIINVSLLFLVAFIVPSLHIDGFWAAIWTVFIISIVNNIIISVAKSSEK